jgi:polar amino acid transport system substrate-binding protein
LTGPGGETIIFGDQPGQDMSRGGCMVRVRNRFLVPFTVAVLVAGSAQAAVSQSEAPAAPAIPDDVAQACSAAAGPTLQGIVDSGVLRIATGIAAPWGFRDPSTNELVGFEPESALQLADTIGVDLEISDFDYGQLVANLQSDISDIVMAGLFVTPERAEAVDFSNVLTKSGQLLYTLEESPINSVEDANSSEYTFVYGTGNAQGELAAELLPEVNVIDAPLRGQNLLYEFLVSGRADVTMSDSLLNPIFVNAYDNLKVIGANGVVTDPFPADDEVLQPFDVAYAVAKGEPDLLACLNTYVDWIKDSGVFEERFVRWMNTAIEQQS